MCGMRRAEVELCVVTRRQQFNIRNVLSAFMVALVSQSLT